MGSANQSRGPGQDGIPTAHRDEVEPMEEETNAHPDIRGVGTGYLLDNTAQWDDGEIFLENSLISICLFYRQCILLRLSDEGAEYAREYKRQ